MYIYINCEWDREKCVTEKEQSQKSSTHQHDSKPIWFISGFDSQHQSDQITTFVCIDF